jgi:hypothetical protein
MRRVAQRVIELSTRGRLEDALTVARQEQVELTTPQPERIG